MQANGMPYPVEGQARQDAGKAIAMVAVDMGDADARDLRGGNIRPDHLALRAVSRVEQDALIVPTEEVAVVVACARRDLGGGTENHEFAHGNECLTPSAQPDTEPIRGLLRRN